MSFKNQLSSSQKTIILALIVAEAGVLLQQISGAPYAIIPPVLFILLVPAALVGFVRARWTGIVSLLAALFLIFGLFGSGAYHRLVSASNPRDSTGLWIQMIAVLIAALYSIRELSASREKRLPRTLPVKG